VTPGVIRRWVCPVAALLSVVVAGCDTTPGGGGDGGPDDPHNQGGSLVIGIVQEPSSFLDANVITSISSSLAIDAPVAEGLLWYRSRDETANARSLADFWRPDLATEVPTLANGDVRTSGCPAVTDRGTVAVPAMCVTWKLRGGVLWHDGSRFGAHDVCATAQFWWLRYGAHNPTAIGGTTGWDQLIGCREDSPTQATLSFRSTDGAYLSLGSGVDGILPARLLDTAFRTGADLEKAPQTVDLRRGTGAAEAYTGTDTLDRIIDGTGPFVLARYEPGREVVLVRNPHYWDPHRRPHLDRLVFRFVADVKSQLDQARAGELDMGLDYRLTFLRDLQDTARGGRLRVVTVPEAGVEKIDLNLCDAVAPRCGSTATPSPFTADLRVRRAMLMGIDRERIVRTIAQGQSVVPQDSWISLGAEFIRDPHVPTTAYDPQAAARLLDSAGDRLSPACHDGRGRADATGRCMDLQFVTTGGNPSRSQAQVAVQADLERLGIFTDLRITTPASLFGGYGDGGVLATHAFQLAMYAESGSAAEPDQWYSEYHGNCGGGCPLNDQIPSAANRGQGGNATGLDDPEVDRALDEGRAAVDLARRARAYMRAEERLAADLPQLPLYQGVAVHSVTTRLRGLQRSDAAATFNSGAWYCLGGRCQA
jgi:ABC-type transport system substrate-binding protein